MGEEMWMDGKLHSSYGAAEPVSETYTCQDLCSYAEERSLVSVFAAFIQIGMVFEE